jgi:hypothetical protein
MIGFGWKLAFAISCMLGKLPADLLVEQHAEVALGFSSCWVFLLAFARGVNSYWGSMTYGYACTLMHLIAYIGKHPC